MRNLLKGIVVFVLFLFVSICLSAQIIDTVWTKTFGGDVNDYGYSVQQTDDGGYIIVGNINDWLGLRMGDVYLIKTDYLGDTLWTKTFGRINSEVGHSVQQTTDGGYIVGGATSSEDTTIHIYDVYLIKTDSLGDTLWTKTYGGDGLEEGLSVQQTTDGGYIVVGETSSYGAGNTDVYLIKTDSLGDTLWTKTYGGAG